MAESTLALEYADLQTAAAVDQGWDRTAASWTADNTAHFDMAVEQGLQRFYFPEVTSTVYRRSAGQGLDEVKPQQIHETYEWSFLRKSTTITLATNDWQYDMPDDFSGVVIDDSVVWDTAGEDKKPLRRIDDGELLSLRDKENATGVPLYFSLRPKTHDATANSTRWEMRVYPTPTADEDTKTLGVDYRLVPDVLDSTNKYPYGGGAHGQTIREAVLAELNKIVYDDPDNVHEQNFQRLLMVSVRLDTQIKEGQQGGRFAYPVNNLPSVDLSVNFFELQRMVGETVGYGLNPNSWSHAETEKVREVIRRGYRMYLYPEAVDQHNKSHTWSFLHPVGEFKTAAGERYYLLPEDFERFIGKITFVPNANSAYPPIEIRSVEQLRIMAYTEEYSSYPRFATDRVIASDGQSWQRRELILHPTPDAEYSLSYEYQAKQRELSETHPYPLGGQPMAELLYTACEAVAEKVKNQKWGQAYDHYKTVLASAVIADLKRGPQTFGAMGRYPMSRSRARARKHRMIAYGTPLYNGTAYTG